MDKLSRCTKVVLGKKTALTDESFTVYSYDEMTLSSDKLLEYAALAESTSHHPIAEKIKEVM